MTEQTAPEPQYKSPPLGAYPVEEHLRAQQEQHKPGTSEPMHAPDDDGDDETDA